MERDNGLDRAGDGGLVFACTFCGEAAQAPGAEARPPWARLSAFGSSSIKILGALDAAILATAQQSPQDLDRAWFDPLPEAGGHYVARVCHPFAALPDAPFWCLFQPALSLTNGWAEHPDEVLQSGLLCCELGAVLHRGENSALVVIEATEVVPIVRMRDRFAESREGAAIAPFTGNYLLLGHGRSACHQLPGFVVVEADCEGDAGAWWLFCLEAPELARPRYRLLLEGDWGFHRDWVSAGNRLLTPDESAELATFLADNLQA